MSKLLIFPFILLIKFYQTLISPLLGSNCRFQPTCSEYCMDSLKTWGLFKGLYLSAKRIIKCHPWGEKGYDPVVVEYLKQPLNEAEIRELFAKLGLDDVKSMMRVKEAEYKEAGLQQADTSDDERFAAMAARRPRAPGSPSTS